MPNIFGKFLGDNIYFYEITQRYWITKPIGNLTFLKFLKKHNFFSNIFIKNKIVYAKSNGVFCYFSEKIEDSNLALITLPSGEERLINIWFTIIIGRNSNIDARFQFFSKAGTRLFFGKKPKVRGVAKNPVDHPHGGRTKTNSPEKSPWGWITKKNK
jgi:ribosomal protein L2